MSQALLRTAFPAPALRASLSSLPRALRSSARSFSRSLAARSDVHPTSLDSFSDEEQMLRESVARFAQEVIAPKVREMDEAEMMDPAIIKALFEQGLMGIETGADHGGAESSFTSAIIAIEELAKVDPSVSVMCDVHNTLVNTVLRNYGTKEQQDKWLPLLSESKLGSFCLSEPASGSDAFALQTRAVKDGNDWVINGSKMWITNSYEADVFLIFANADPSKGYKGITCFIATKDMGVQIAKKEQKLGIRASSTCSLNFDDLRVPAENIIGGEGKGYKIAIEILNEGRIGIAAQMIGLAQGAFAKAVPYTFERKQFGQPVGTFQGLSFQQARAACDIEAARLLTYNAARRKEEGKSFVREAAIAKLVASEVAQKVSGAAIEWAGGVGFTRETGIEKYWRDSKIGAIYEGTSNIQLQTIAKLIQKEYS
ncbi:mitochondrial acyl-CoA dehydrogenase [Fomitopsis serialis]|uniref:mitochondrial acyl-CoA dehydrogenase n=1 Tax=Fomitopsis serialis TaxID=139415 RepID=UPI002008D508|nr:mitochondrial acyl-CoA dehydrogenase [Neoantrodia serialis]KAH9928972.1 mitochondrial acyl-CoA dehydrogenase [Neoantrodia serialis]